MTALTLKYNDLLREVFQRLGFTQPNQENLKESFKVYQKVLAGMSLDHVKPDNRIELKPVKKDRSPAQKRASLVHKDKMNTAKQDMINHIKDLIDDGELSYSEFLNDPTVYFDSQIMGKYYNNPIICKSIVKYFEVEYIPF